MFIMILFFSMNNNTLTSTTIEFHNKKACETAVEKFYSEASKFPYNGTRQIAFCVQKGT